MSLIKKLIAPLACTTLLTLVMAAGCSEDQNPTSMLRQAMEDYRVCIEAPTERTSCEEEEKDLVDQMSEPTFRKLYAKATADCGGNVSITCSGHSCGAVDGLGCLCHNTEGKIESFKLCD